ncbi:ADL172Wp [Eremothecium gossypii ATCC 10895]|uniref:ADL172Wp n=1 Tax=Eremothecium gossypii (strain ATCC 10895 / CBS 109.51 / FGSC 9923 / NRRL Y-1056) TaxID=284811 RepID=Q75AU2_EREGS|nr:ADL172Wp [Eremothecium gossypii ATCC 10895]AAS51748.1 ADL172Wp [Eremothecium gossypii ATCC 10895]AEY96045.1 FADL172Wp [Eremothecium gossypii FDAG1]
MSLDMDTRPLSPQKEQEIASKILQRAELAQMTRQLKLGLSRVASPKKGSSAASCPNAVNKTAVLRGPGPRMKDGLGVCMGAIAGRCSPIKMSRSAPAISRLLLGKAKTGCATTPDEKENEEGQSPAKRHKQGAGAADGRGGPQRGALMDMIKPLPSTPKSHREAAPRRPAVGASAGTLPHGSEDVGADLLMYLATSPYASAAKQHHTSSPRVPMTPSYLHHASSAGDPRPAQAWQHPSPHAVPKMSQNYAAAQAGASPSMLLGQEAFHELGDSPGMSMYMSPQTHRLKGNGGYLLPTASISDPSVLGDTGRPPSSQSLTSHLLRTPNFNMNDYVHNLFSPSPRIDPPGSSGNI